MGTNNEIDQTDGKKTSDSKDNVLPMVDFTDIIGANGVWQFRLLVIGTLMCIPIAWNHMMISLLTVPEGYWCERPENSSIPVEEWRLTAVFNVTSNYDMQQSQCEMNISKNNSSQPEIIPCQSWEFESNKRTIIKQWNLVCDKSWMVSMSQSVYMGGVFAASLISSQLADTFGRYPVIMGNIVIHIVSGIAAAFSTSFLMFVVSRFFVAFGQAGLGMTYFVLMIEATGAPHRAWYCLVQCFGWNFGYCVLPLMAYYLADWNYLQLAITLPSVVFIFLYWTLHESPRWLLSRGKIDRAVIIMNEAAQTNGKKIENMEVEIKKLSLEKEEEKGGETLTICNLLVTPNSRKKTLILYFIWATISFVYYGLSLNPQYLSGNYYVNFFLSGVVEIPGTIFCIPLLNRFGRKIPLLSNLLIGGIACIGCLFIPVNLSWVQVTVAMIGKLAVSSAFNIIYIYTAEIFPTVARNLGVGSCSTISRIGTMIAPFTKELGRATSSEVVMVLFGILSVISGGLLSFLPETKDCPIPETLEDAENIGKSEKSCMKINCVKRFHEVT